MQRNGEPLRTPAAASAAAPESAGTPLSPVLGAATVVPSGRKLGKAAFLLLGVSVFIGVLWMGALPCLTATLFHTPCPGCGSTRSTKALLTLDFAGWLRFNPVGPLMAFLMLVLVVRAVYVVARDGDAGRLADGRMGTYFPRAVIGVFILEVGVWALRFFGLLGGPCPV